ncbi:MAG: sugar transferase [Pseudomonadota bacterium]
MAGLVVTDARGDAALKSLKFASRDLVKRVFDVVVASLALIVALPLFLLIGFLVSRDGGPVFYSHRRVGRGGEPFDCLKFRSMSVNGADILRRHLAENKAARDEWNERRKITNDPRVTRIGRFLRASSLDELPQLINVLRGEMSLVGPRPITDEELARYGRHARNYVECVPGITGLWQVSGRSETTYRRRVALDTVYSIRRDFLLDLEIIVRTVPAVLLRYGAE